MRLFGYELKKINENKYTPNIVSRWQFGREHANKYDVNSQIEAYKSWVYVCVKRNSVTFASTPHRLYVAKKSKSYMPKCLTCNVSKEQRKYLDNIPGIANLECVKKANDIEEVLDHRYLDTMKNVNPFMNRFGLLESANAYQDLSGDFYMYMILDKAGLPTEFWAMPSQNMKVIPDRDKFISGYTYTQGIDKVRFEENEIVHFLYFNPNDPYYGLSPLMAVASMYNIMTNMNEYENALFTNNAKLEGYWSTDEAVSDTEFNRLKKELDEYKGVKNSGMTPFLDKGVKFNPLNLPPKELAFLKGREWTQKEIYAAFDNYTQLDDPDANRANSETADYKYMKYGISPRHRRFEEKLNEKVMPLYDDKLFCAFDNCVPEDKAFEVVKNVEYVKVGISLRNEVRQEIGLEPYEGGDDPIMPGAGFGASAFGNEPPAKEIETFTSKVANLVREKLLV